MAFLDNSGTIILDAILTDVGRKRMAQGNFKVSKFCLGDDEIDYSVINTTTDDHDSVETLKPMEALNAENAVINYGLLDYSSDDIVYVPQIKVNEKNKSFIKKYVTEDTFYYLSANDETTKKLRTLLGSPRFILENGFYERTKLVFESGIENPSIKRDPIAKERYILNYNLYDKYFIISCDHRFVDKLLIVKDSESYFENDGANNLFFNFETLQDVPSVSLNNVVENYSSYIATGIDNQLFPYRHGKDRNLSAINGPRGTICAINFKLNDKLTINTSGDRDFRYVKFGLTDQILFGGSDKFDLIDTTIYIQGVSTSARLQVPIRILRYAGT
jgi:hypothetical protein